MKKILLTSISLFLSFLSNAQEPNLAWVNQLGGTALDQAKSIVTDASGNSYTTGIFNQTADLDSSSGVLNFTAFGTNNYPDVFITKLNPSGGLIWTKRIGGVGVENVFSITLDSAGNAYITGTSNGTCDFDPGTTVSNLSPIGVVDVFILKLDTNGDFVWAKRMGGSSFTSGTDLVVDANQNVYVTGFFGGTADFNPSAATNSLTAAGYYDVFVLKLDNLGNYVWANRLGGIEYDYASSIGLDSNNNVYTTGKFANGGDFDPGAATYTLETNLSINGPISNTFISKLDNAGNFVWAKSFKGTGFYSNLPYSAALDNQNNIYITGEFANAVDFDTSAAVQNTISIGSRDTYVVKLNETGDLQWIKQFGGIGAMSETKAICLDASNNVYTTGRINTGTTDFDPGAGVANVTCVYDYDVFISKLNSSGEFVWVRALAGDELKLEESFDISVDVNNDVYTVGIFNGTLDFDPNAGIVNLTSLGNTDGFIQKLSQNPLAITENSKSNVVLFPNPANDQINLNFDSPMDNATVQISSISGQILWEKKDFAGTDFNMDITKLTTGLYIVHIFNNTITFTTKFIKN